MVKLAAPAPRPAATPPPPAEPVALRVSPWGFAIAFSLVAAGFLALYWEQFPVVLRLFSSYWRRDSRFLVPNWPVFAQTWIANLRAAGFLAGFLLLSWAAGQRALKWAVGWEADRLVRALFALGLGNGLLGILTLGLGLAGLLDARMFWPVFVLGLGGAAWSGRWWRGLPIGLAGAVGKPAEGGDEPARLPETLFHWAGLAVAAACLVGLYLLVRDLMAVRRLGGVELAAGAALAVGGVLAWGIIWHWSGLASRARGWIDAGLGAFIAFILLLNFIPAFEPEWFYDSLVYHLAVPEQWLIARRICYLGHTFFSNFPFLQEMQYTFLLALGDDVAPKLLHWAHGALSAAAAYALGRAVFGRTGGLMAAAVFCSQPVARFLAHITMVELGLTWFEALATLAVFRACGWGGPAGGSRRWMLLAGWFLGFAQGTKYIGLFSSVLLLGWWWLAHARTRNAWPRVLRDTGLAVGWASVWTGVWLGKNWLFTGNPFFPLMQTVFGGIGWDAAHVTRWMHDNVKYGTGHGSLEAWLTMPLKASIDIPDFGTFTLNPFPLLFLPVLAFVPRVPAAVRFCAFYGFGYAVIWATSSQQTRFLYPAMVQAAVAVAFVALRAGAGAWAARGALSLAATWILVVGAFGMVHNRYSNNALVPYTTGHLSREDLLRLGVQYYETVRYAGTVTGSRDRVLFLAGDENYYMPRRRICNSIYDRSWLGDEAARAADAPALLKALRRNRVTRFIVHEARGDEYAPYGIYDWGRKAQDTFLEVWHAYAKPEFDNKGVFLFQLQAKPVPAADRKGGRPSWFYPGETVRRSVDLVHDADLAFQANRKAEGLRICEELVRLMPEVSHARAYRGYALGLSGRRREAMADYELAIRYGWPTAVVYYNLGILLEADKKYARCLDLYEKAIAMDPGLSGVQERAMEAAIQLRRFGKALTYGEAALAAKPTDRDLDARVARLRQVVTATGPGSGTR